MDTQAHEAAVKAFLEANGEAYISEEAANAPSMASIQGVEVSYDFYASQQDLLDTVLEEIAEEEAGDASVWEVNELDSPFGHKANQNVMTLAHWNGKLITDDSGKPIGTRFVPDLHKAHDKRTSKHRAQFCIEFCYCTTTGKVVKQSTARARLEPEVKKVKQSKRILAALKRIDLA